MKEWILLMEVRPQIISLTSLVKQYFFEVSRQRKYALLLYFLRRNGKKNLRNKRVLVFARTQQRAERLAEALNNDKFIAASLHSEYSPAQREKIVEDFKSGAVQILVATDVMARGMDIPQLDSVVNYDVPHSSEDYVHRVGRTGRAGATGE
jgi:ATP-dependent RNA helicase RhlE